VGSISSCTAGKVQLATRRDEREKLMQMFVAVLSNVIDRGEFEKSWRLDSADNLFPGAGFTFAGQTISLKLEPGPDGRWQTESVHRAFTSVIRRVDQSCNIRWK
jgi:hypothetical protein